MKYFPLNFIIVVICIALRLPCFCSVNGIACSPYGYTIETINGIFTDKDGAIVNRDNLRHILTKHTTMNP